VHARADNPSAAAAPATSETRAPTTTPATRAAVLALVKEGNRLLDAGHAEQALAKFREAHALVGGTKLQFNFAQAYRAMPGHEADAYIAYGLFLARSEGAASDLVAFARREQESLRRSLALVSVTTHPTGATVTIDGIARGNTPLPGPVVLMPGAHTLKLAKEGHRPSEDLWTLQPGQTLERMVDLVPLLPLLVQTGDEHHTPLAQRPPPPRDSSTKNVDLGIRAQTTETSPPIYKTWWFWSALGVVALGGAVAGIVATRGPHYECPPTSSGQCPQLP
jgi:hypothetical protein